MQMKIVGRHLIVEFWGCQNLDDPAGCEKALREAVAKAGATLIDVKVHHFNPHGVTGIAIIAESHISVHTWPELDYAAVDIFTCGETADPLAAVEVLQQQFQPRHTQMLEIHRGVLNSGR